MTRNLLACTALTVALGFHGAASGSTTLNTGGSVLAAPTYISAYQTYTASNPSILFNYEAAGNAAGQKAFLNNDITQFETLPSTTLTYGTIAGSQVDIGASDIALTAAQLINPATGSYAESSLDGPLIQIPTFGLAVAVPYNETGVPKSGLTLSDVQECGVFSGKIADWHTLVPSIPAGTPIHVVYPAASSDLTFLLSQHLSPVCTSSNSNFLIPLPVTPIYGNLFPGGHAPMGFISETNSLQVANAILGTPNSIGILTPDYTSFAPKSGNTTALKAASLENADDGKLYTPTVVNIETALESPGAGATNPTPPTTMSSAMDPLNWVPAIPLPTKGYPIVGYTTMEISSCYASKTAGSAIVAFLTDFYKNSAYVTLIENNGFAPVSNAKASPYITAIDDVFLTNSDGYDLNIDNAASCAGYMGR